MNFGFNGKTVIVTGGTAGIGNSICKSFLKTGASVVFTSRHADEGKKVEDALKNMGDCLYIRCNSQSEDDIKNLIDKTISRYKKIDILINNAAVYIYKIMDNCSSDEFDFMYRVNLRGYFLTCKYAIPHLKKTKGAIVNISSIVGKVGQYYTSLYCATKGGITSFTKAIALDYAKDGIRANIVLPGAIDTNSSNIGREGNQLNYPDEMLKIGSALQPLGRKLCSSEEVANATLFLASNLASGITGTTLVVDRGATLDLSPGMLTYYDK